ncbi:MAG: TonB-dependent receptor, partial [Gammaproteobacteria bacterium]|nr:TonB-dependent receptor [Gammaproteobacteria bacterium]
FNPDEQDSNSDQQAKDYAISVRWSSAVNSQHNISLQANAQQWERLREWRACDAQISFDPAFNKTWQTASLAERQVLLQDLLNGGKLAHSCGLISENSREARYDIELQDTYSVSDRLRLISGLSYRYDQARSQTFLNGRQRKDIVRGFSQIEWYLTDHWLLQGGGMLEHDSDTGDTFSPRLAVNYMLTPAHGLRAIYSEAVRSPDMFEQHADWRYRVRDLRPTVAGSSAADFFISSQSTGQLKQEKIKAYELGYNGHFARQRATIDIKIFEEKISRMISHSPRLESFNLTNNDHIKFTGTELEANWQATHNHGLRLSYAYINERASHPLDQKVSPPHSGSISWLYKWGYNWNASVMYFAAQQLHKQDLQLATFRVAKLFYAPYTRITVAGNLQKTLNNQPIGRTNNKDHSHDYAYASVQLEF